MTKKHKLIIIISLIIVGILCNFIFYVKRHSNLRGETSLINQYFKLRDHHPLDAKHALERILQHDPKNFVAMRELGYWYLRQGNVNSALKQFSLTHEIYPNEEIISFELGKLFILTQQYSKAKYLLTSVLKTNNLQLKQHAKIALSQIPLTFTEKIEAPKKGFSIQGTKNAKIQPFEWQKFIWNIKSSNIRACSILSKTSQGQTLPKAALKKSTERNTLFNQYYALKKNHPQQAWQVLHKILTHYPHDVDALKEAGYTTLNAKNNISAYHYFKRAYEITRDSQLAMQLGYISLDLDKKKLAYYYFDLATNTKEIKQRIDAEMAKTNMTSAQLKLLPEPYYADIFYDPFYYSRFKMIVQPTVIKVGKLINEKYQLKMYLSYQRTSDNRSNFSQQLPQIFQDNTSITAVGAGINPIPSAPLTAFMEAGKAVDLVYQNRSRWRSDLRGGLAYYKDWGERPIYTLEPVFSNKIVGDFYSDMIYFSRYRDIIGSVRLREGIRIFKYETSSIDLYLKGFVVWDTSHQYYNNILEWGPGVAITPSNRYNVVLHLEALQGHYIPVTSPSPNPYNSNYHNNLLLLDVYFRL
ncbi:MAG: hypothetical protein K0S27_1342 [Gammaproteobacteria bacterium]|nr:hypothetical protein [Gammaproteobacteria bacterium]